VNVDMSYQREISPDINFWHDAVIAFNQYFENISFCGYQSVPRCVWERFEIFQGDLVLCVMVIMNAVMNYIIDCLLSFLFRIENDIGPDFAVSMQ